VKLGTWVVAAAVVLVLVGVGIDVYLVRQDGVPLQVSASSTVRPTSSTVRPASSTTATAQASPRTRPPAGRPILFVAYDYNSVPSYSGVRPSSIDLSNDGTNGISDIKWASWGTTAAGTGAEAIGYGQHSSNDCIPYCYDGTFQYWRDRIVLSDPVPGSPTVWGRMTETYDGQTSAYVYCGAGPCRTWVTGAS
jgi:hypothetical protein